MDGASRSPVCPLGTQWILSAEFERSKQEMALLSPLTLEDYLRLSFGSKSSNLVLFYNEHIKDYIEILPKKKKKPEG